MRRLLVTVGTVVLLAALGLVATLAPRAVAGEPAAAVAVVASGDPAPAPPTPPEPARPPRVVAFGDSLLSEAEDYLVWVGGATGLEVQAGSWGGTAICDWFDDAANVAGTPDAYVFAFSGNGITPCMRGHDGEILGGPALAARYAADVDRAMYLVGGEVPVYWVLAPIPQRASSAANASLVAAAIARTAAAWPNVTVVDANRFISPDGVWNQTLPCLFFEPCTGPVSGGVPSNVVRSPDGAHFCPTGAEPVDGRTLRCDGYSSGAMRYALTVLDAVAPLKDASLRR